MQPTGKAHHNAAPPVRQTPPVLNSARAHSSIHYAPKAWVIPPWCWVECYLKAELADTSLMKNRTFLKVMLPASSEQCNSHLLIDIFSMSLCAKDPYHKETFIICSLLAVDAQQRVTLDFLADHAILKNYMCVFWGSRCCCVAQIKSHWCFFHAWYFSCCSLLFLFSC